jgi:hypothetical protein
MQGGQRVEEDDPIFKFRRETRYTSPDRRGAFNLDAEDMRVLRL